MDAKIAPATTLYTAYVPVYTGPMSKHLVDIDDSVLSDARAELRTATIKDTVNEALRRVGAGRRHRVGKALDVLAKAALADRETAWR